MQIQRFYSASNISHMHTGNPDQSARRVKNKLFNIMKIVASKYPYCFPVTFLNDFKQQQIKSARQQIIVVNLVIQTKRIIEIIKLMKI